MRTTMFADQFIKKGRIIDGQYNISIDLNGLLEPEAIDKFKYDFKELQES